MKRYGIFRPRITPSSLDELKLLREDCSMEDAYKELNALKFLHKFHAKTKLVYVYIEDFEHEIDKVIKETTDEK